uniref:Regulatory factor X1 n=1 Tax=Cyclopterus lumpus TaxID=8103 RepID=A0A8C2ZJ29_CYCLU
PTSIPHSSCISHFPLSSDLHGSVHSNDSLSDSSPPAPTQVVQPVESIQQVRCKHIQKGTCSVCIHTHTHTHTHTHIHTHNRLHTRTHTHTHTHTTTHTHLVTFHVTQLCLLCVYMFLFVCAVGVCVCVSTCLFLSSRSSNYPFSDSPLYSQTPPTSSSSYYETTPSTESDITGSVTSQPVSVATAGANCGGAAAGGGGYVIQGGYMLGGGAAGGGGGQSFSNPNSRAPPATVSTQVQSEQCPVYPRCTLYYHYLLHCQEQKLEPLMLHPLANFIRSVFMGLRTRRLGTRGNSKYHYYGLRIKSGSPLQQPFLTVKTGIRTRWMGQQQAAALCDISAQVQQYQQFLEPSRALPDFVDIDLQDRTLEHCEAILDVMVNLQFTLVETLWKSFWRFSQSSDTESLHLHNESEKRLPKSCLVVLCKYEPVLRWTKECDNLLYQTLVEILIPDVLRPIPSALTQAIRNFAKSLENWLTGAMMNIPDEMVVCVGSFSQTLRRYTSLNHLAQAARAVLQNTAQINQMLSDLNRVDFTNVQEQASWVCQCEDRVVQQLEQDFKMTLQQQNSLSSGLPGWTVLSLRPLKPYEHNSVALPKAAKVFLLNWSFYSSMVIRDLTLRSAASFGSFHLIRLLYDEYMYYLIEHRVAQAKGVTPIAVMGEVGVCAYKEEEDDEEEESEDEGGDLVLQSSSLSAMDDEKDPMEPPAKLPRTSFNLHTD